MSAVKLGLKENLSQFVILVIINAFVGAMVGMERSIFPEYAESIFGISTGTALLSFIAAFGFTKAVTNYFTGKMANRFGRKNLLIAGWILALPVPWILIYAHDWSMVIMANAILGASQGLAWSSTVVMKIDLVGEKERGLAMGINEFAGYLAVGIMAFATGYISGHYGVIPYPFYLGAAISMIGLIISILWVKDTSKHVHHEHVTDLHRPLVNVFRDTTYRHSTLGSVTQAGFVNNLNDGMIWGLLPLWLLTLNFTSVQIGIIAAVYPAVWGIGQLFTGKMADRHPRKMLLVLGMALQALAILIMPALPEFLPLLIVAIVLGIGTAMVYPTFLTVIASSTGPSQRAESMGIFRLWRDLGYAFGALSSGIVADLFGIEYAILMVGIITLISAIIIQVRMPAKEESAKECIEPEEADETVHAGARVRIIDVRSPGEYVMGHIDAAENIPLENLSQAAKNWKSDEQIITVCAKGGGRSTEAAKILRELGFHAMWMCGGTEKWKAVHS